MRPIKLGTTDRTVLVYIPDSTSTTGAGKTGLNAAALTVSYTRVETDNDAGSLALRNRAIDVPPARRVGERE